MKDREVELSKAVVLADVKLYASIIVATGTIICTIIYYLFSQFNNIDVQLAILKANTQNLNAQITTLNLNQSFQGSEIEQLSSGSSARLNLTQP